MRLLALVCVVGCGDRKPEPKPAPEERARPADARRCDPAEPHVCAGDAVVECATNKVVQACKDGCSHGACADPCAAQGVELIYVVAADHQLMSFDPRKLPDDPFHLVGTMVCEPDAQPFSMAVDRGGIAWVEYDNGQLFRVSILDAHCTPVGQPSTGPTTFGMGFAADGSASETLYLAASDDAHDLGRLDTGTLKWTSIAAIDMPAQKSSPELTGTADGKLFGYFTEPSPGFVQEIDRATAKLVGARHKLAGAAGEHQAWAFAHYAGVFYVFTTIDGNSAVYAVKRKTGAFALVKDHLPFQIVGAGVSTCAPELERP